MDNFRLVLFFSLAFVLLLTYQAWVKDYGQPSQQAATAPSTEQSISSTSSVKADPSVPDVESFPSLAPVAVDSPSNVSKGRAITVTTDTFSVEISTIGGTIQSAYLLNYPVDPATPDTKFQLLKSETPNLYLAQSGLIGAESSAVPTHEAEFKSDKNDYKLEDGQEDLSVMLTWINDSGISVIKKFTFHRNSYLIDLVQEVRNDGSETVPARAYYQLQRSLPFDPKKSTFIHTYTGTALYSPEEKYEKISFDEIADPKTKLERSVTDGWVAMLQHYFISALVPPQGEPQTFYTNSLSGPRYVIGMYSETKSIAPGTSAAFATQVFAGPKLQHELAKVAEGLELAVDYGWLTILAQPIFWLLEKLHGLVNNWGGAIILLTLLIKLAFYKLSETSYKSMANMRKLTPRLQALKDRYGDDKERLNQAMMKMYKEEKINPLGGCLPIVIQIPVFISLYWVVLESVEMRQAPFALWINNLSAPDPYFVLPLIMGVSMFVQQKLNPAPVDPMQQKIMMSLPFVFTIFFAFFPAGLVLYWVVNNLLSIAQQWHITRRIEAAADGKSK